MYVLELRAYELEFRLMLTNKDFIVSNSSSTSSMNDSKQPAGVLLNALSVFANALKTF